MEEQVKFEVDPKMLSEIGLPKEMIDKILNSSNPSINNHAEGGKGGHSISLTYVDNYSSLLLVYTFLLNTTQNSQRNNNMLNEALLSTLKTSLKEQQEYRLAFLNAVNSLSQK